MINYLQEKGGYTSTGLKKVEKLELENLRIEIKRYEELEKAMLEKDNNENSEEKEMNSNYDSQSQSCDCFSSHHS